MCIKSKSTYSYDLNVDCSGKFFINVLVTDEDEKPKSSVERKFSLQKKIGSERV